MALVKIKMLVCVAGDTFSHVPGDLIDVESEIAKAWVKEGLAIAAPDVETGAARIADLEKKLDETTRSRDGLAALKADLEGKLAAAQTEKKAAQAEMAVHKKAATEAAARISTLEKELAAATAPKPEPAS